ncbi:protein S100-A13 [Neosynchiropus ocellatus]
MESAIQTIVTTFLTSARGKDSLDKKAAQKLVQKQFSGLMEDTNCSSAVKEMLNGLDENTDGKINFPEYMKLVGHIAKSLSERQAGGDQAAA